LPQALRRQDEFPATSPKNPIKQHSGNVIRLNEHSVRRIAHNRAFKSSLLHLAPAAMDLDIRGLGWLERGAAFATFKPPSPPVAGRPYSASRSLPRDLNLASAACFAARPFLFAEWKQRPPDMSFS
jgi:hypothetical protein